MRHWNIVIVLATVSLCLVPATTEAKTRSSGSTTTVYSKGKPVGKAITHGNTTHYYARGKPVGKSIRR